MARHGPPRPHAALAHAQLLLRLGLEGAAEGRLEGQLAAQAAQAEQQAEAAGAAHARALAAIERSVAEEVRRAGLRESSAPVCV